MHTASAPDRGQDVSCTQRAPRNAYGAPPGQGRSPTLVLTVRDSPTYCPASCQREGRTAEGCAQGGGGQLRAAGGDGEGSASLVDGPGAREAALGAWGVDPQPQESEGRRPRPCPWRSFKGPGLGVGLAPQLLPATQTKYTLGKPRS